MSKTSRFFSNQSLLIIGILLLATNLRAPFTSLAPLLAPISDYFSLTSTQAGLIQTLPLLAFALFSPFSAVLAKKMGIEKVLFIALLIIAGGILLRSYGGVSGLYIGTALIGMGISFGNVLLPAILKKELPNKASSLTGFYALTMGIAAALCSALVVPIVTIMHMSWQSSLLITLILPVMAAIMWFPQLRRQHSQPTVVQSSDSTKKGSVWGVSLAWQVSLFFGFNSFIYYIIVAWLPSILKDAGFSLVEAGQLHGVLQLATAVPGFFIGPLLARLKDHKGLGVIVALIGFFGVVGLVVLPALSTVWVIFIGLSTGAGIILGLAFIGLRSNNALQASALSGMAQSVGYLLAAGGPPIVGLLHDHFSSWQYPLLGCSAIALILAGLGYQVGRARLLPEHV